MYFCKANLKINMSVESNTANNLLKNIITAIQDVKGEDIISLDLRKLNSAVSDYFVICTGKSDTQVKAIQRNIEQLILKKNSEKVFNIEGSNIGEWILMDYSDIIVHIFQKKTRDFYNIEDFWGDAEFTEYED
tara:strand:+ start:230 stop:628 length:399 start_codon:yes stop_codon:yes gene_type:complete